MGDVTVRVAILLAAGVAVGLFALVLKRRRSRPARMIPVTGLDPGTYLFTSATCAECAVARSQLESFTEISWEGQPDVFNRLGVTAVPSTLEVDSAGVGAWRAWVPETRNP